MKAHKGITLIALIITIILLLILSTVAITSALGGNGLIARAKNARIQSAIAAKKEEVQMAIQMELIDNQGDSSKVKLSSIVEDVKKKYSDKEKKAITGETTGSTPDGFPGKITYNKPASGIKESIIIEIDENLNVTGSTGEGSGQEQESFNTTSEYTKVGGAYCNSPELGGFNSNCTYYVTYDDTGTLVSEDTPISKPAPDGWYDYAKKKWANVVTKNNGNTTYWVWIPRFKYTTDSTTKTTTARFVDMNDKCYMDENNVKTEVDVSSYKISDAFTFNGNQLPGYWVAKYRIQEGTDDGTSDPPRNTLGKIDVDLSGFDSSCTYYVTYDDSGTKTSENIPISEKAPEGWYDYSKKKWANVMTNNNGLKTYWTYIPRYEYQMWQELKQTNIRFISPSTTQNNVEEGFKVPDSFTFGGQQIKGYWVSKYRIQDSQADTSVFKGSYYK